MGFKILTVDENGLGATYIFPNHSSSEIEPAFSPNGDFLAFTSETVLDSSNEVSELYIYNFRTGEALQVTHLEGLNREADWSSNGLIAFSNQAYDAANILVVDPNSKNVQTLTSSQSLNLNPAWSPDGDRLAFASNRLGTFDVFQLDLYNLDTARLTDLPGDELYPAWSPSGNKIVFASDTRGDFDLYLLSIGSGRIERVASIPGDQFRPEWTPNGCGIIFISNESGKDLLYSIELKSGDISQLDFPETSSVSSFDISGANAEVICD
jgi:TolB protein